MNYHFGLIVILAVLGGEFNFEICNRKIILYEAFNPEASTPGFFLKLSLP